MLPCTSPESLPCARCSTWCGIARMLRPGTWSNLPLQAKGLLIVAVPATATVMIACAVYALGARTTAEEDRVRHSLGVNREVQRLKASETAANSAVRGYFLTADEAF